MKDYIERDGIMSRIAAEALKWGEDYDADQILGDIEDFPAADVRPVVRGRWEEVTVDMIEDLEFPHLTTAKETAWLVKKYGKLDENCPQMLHDGFAEGMRVLKPDGVLIFKWSEYNIPASEVWKAIGQKPLFGHHSGKKSTTFWGCFMKGET